MAIINGHLLCVMAISKVHQYVPLGMAISTRATVRVDVFVSLRFRGRTTRGPAGAGLRWVQHDNMTSYHSDLIPGLGALVKYPFGMFIRFDPQQSKINGSLVVGLH